MLASTGASCRALGTCGGWPASWAREDERGEHITKKRAAVYVGRDRAGASERAVAVLCHAEGAFNGEADEARFAGPVFD